MVECLTEEKEENKRECINLSEQYIYNKDPLSGHKS